MYNAHSVLIYTTYRAQNTGSLIYKFIVWLYPERSYKVNYLETAEEPNRYMHSGVEMVDLRDMFNLARLLVEYSISMKI